MTNSSIVVVINRAAIMMQRDRLFFAGSIKNVKYPNVEIPC